MLSFGGSLGVFFEVLAVFFLGHENLLRKDINDERVIQIIKRCLKSGVMVTGFLPVGSLPPKQAQTQMQTQYRGAILPKSFPSMRRSSPRQALRRMEIRFRREKRMTRSSPEKRRC